MSRYVKWFEELTLDDVPVVGGKNASLTAEQSVNGLLDTLDGLSSDDLGAFIQHDGERLPW